MKLTPAEKWHEQHLAGLLSVLDRRPEHRAELLSDALWLERRMALQEATRLVARQQRLTANARWEGAGRMVVAACVATLQPLVRELRRLAREAR